MKNNNLKRYDMGFNLAGLSTYTDETGGLLLAEAIVKAKTAELGYVQSGIKGTQALNLLDSTPTFQAGACSLSASGSTTFTQRNITTCPETLFESFCYKQLYPTYQSMLMNAGQTSESVPFEQIIGDLKVKQIQQRIEQKLWQATTAGGDCFDGFKTLIATGVANSSGATFSNSASYGTSGNPITEIDNLINVLDDNAMSREDLVVFMSYANFRLYVQSLTKGNFFANYLGATSIDANMEATHPNTNVKIVPTIGLASSNKVTIGPREYMVVGFDLTSDHEKLDMWYSKDFDEVRLRANYNYGAQVAKFGSTAYFATNGLS